LRAVQIRSKSRSNQAPNRSSSVLVQSKSWFNQAPNQTSLCVHKFGHNFHILTLFLVIIFGFES
jgi:hypothetical protein